MTTETKPPTLAELSDATVRGSRQPLRDRAERTIGPLYEAAQEALGDACPLGPRLRPWCEVPQHRALAIALRACDGEAGD